MNTVTIEHPKFGKVGNVVREYSFDRECDPDFGNNKVWKKIENGCDMMYRSSMGWREVVQVWDVTDLCRVDEWTDKRKTLDIGNTNVAIFNYGYTPHKVQAVVLPEDGSWVSEWLLSKQSINKWIKQYETTCLQIWEDER